MTGFKPRIGITGWSTAPTPAATPYVQDSSATIQQHLLIGFAAQNRRGYYGRGLQVGAQTPETALRHVAQTIVLAGYSVP
jgi:hypothetical protein